MTRKPTKKKTKHRLTAKNADIHSLYQLSVQEPSADISFIERRFKQRNARKVLVLREDFCGTALMCAEWVRGKPARSAHGVDLDQQPLNWGRTHNLGTLTDEEVARVQLYQQDVRDPIKTKADVTCAFNFSYSVFKERQQLLDYCRAAKAGLTKEGLSF